MKYVKEVLNNPGLLPKIVVLIYRCGYLIYFKLKIPVIRQLCYIIYRLIDFVIVRLLLNCDLPAATPIGLGLTIYHPYGIIINSSAKIGTGIMLISELVLKLLGMLGLVIKRKLV